MERDRHNPHHAPPWTLYRGDDIDGDRTSTLRPAREKGTSEQRKSTYLTLGVAEAILVPLLLWEAFRATDAEKVLSGGGFARSIALQSAASIGVFFGWRSWVWAFKPEWFGQSGSVGKGKTQ